MANNHLPNGWDEERIRVIADHYDRQSEDEALAEDEAAYADQSQSFVEVPVELVPAVRDMIAEHKRSA